MKKILYFVISNVVIILLWNNISVAILDIPHLKKELGILPELDNLLEPSNDSNIDDILSNLVVEQVKENNLKNNHHSIDSDKDSIFLQRDSAEIIILNKLTTEAKNITINSGGRYFFGNFSIELHKCIQNLTSKNTNNLMLITILEHRIDDENIIKFYGWINSLAPSILTFEHPIYELISKQCISN